MLALPFGTETEALAPGTETVALPPGTETVALAPEAPGTDTVGAPDPVPRNGGPEPPPWDVGVPLEPCAPAAGFCELPVEGGDCCAAPEPAGAPAVAGAGVVPFEPRPEVTGAVPTPAKRVTDWRCGAEPLRPAR